MNIQKTIQAQTGVLALFIAVSFLLALGGCKGMSDAPFGSTITVEAFGEPVILNPVSTPSVTAATTKTQKYRVTVADEAGLPLNGLDVNLSAQFTSGQNIDFGGAVGTVTGGALALSTTKQTGDFGYLLFEITVPYYAANQIHVPYNQTATASSTGGSLGDGTYSYTVTALDYAGETDATAPVSAVVTNSTPTTATGSVAISWQAVPGATSYRVYGRGPGVGALVTILNPTGDPITWTDTGSNTPGAAPPGANSTGLSLNSVIGKGQVTTGAAAAEFDINF